MPEGSPRTTTYLRTLCFIRYGDRVLLLQRRHPPNQGLYNAPGGKIERDEDLHRDEPCAEAHRWLHATYAVAARDETVVAHQAYMRALDAVLRHVRTPVAS